MEYIRSILNEKKDKTMKSLRTVCSLLLNIFTEKNIIKPDNIDRIYFLSTPEPPLIAQENTIEEAVNKYICLSLKNLNDEKKHFINDLLKWVPETRVRLNNISYEQIANNRTLKEQIKLFLGDVKRKQENHAIQTKQMVDLFESITFNASDNNNGNLIFELSEKTAEKLATHIDTLTTEFPDVTMCAFLAYIGFIEILYDIPHPDANTTHNPMHKGGRLRMNHKRNKTNRPNQKRNKRIFSRIIKYKGNI